MAESFPSCFVCDGTDFQPLFTKKGRHFWRCRDCGLQKQHPLPAHEELAAYYERSYQSGMYEEFADAKTLKDLTAQERLREIRGTVPFHGRWLDVGASTGSFVHAARQLGVAAEGVELSEAAVARGRELGVPIYHGTLESTEVTAPFDCITAFDLIEHVLDPPQFIREVRKRLSESGYLVLTLPNLSALQRYLMGSRWYFYIPEEHLHYFTPTVIRRFLQRYGMLVKQIRPAYKPMTFDYAQTQFRDYNPMVYRTLRALGSLAPATLRQYPVPLPIGEMCVIAQKLPDFAH